MRPGPPPSRPFRGRAARLPRARGRRPRLALPLLLLAAGSARADGLADLRARFRREEDEPCATGILTVQAIAALGTEDAARLLLDVVETDEDTLLRLNTIRQVARTPPRSPRDGRR